MGETFSITPEGMKTSEGIKRTNEAIDAKQKADAKCAEVLEEFYCMFSGAPIFRTFIHEYTADDEWTNNMLEDMMESVENVQKAREELLRAIAGHPSRS